MTELKGASFKIVEGTDESSPLVEGLSWVSDGTIKELKLKPRTYTLVKTIAPKGYEKAQSPTFKILPKGCIQKDAKYISFSKIKENTFTEPIYIKNLSSDESPTIAYCFNISKQTPPLENSISVAEYTEILDSSDIFTSKASKPRVKGDNLKNSILRVIYNGYPNNALKIKEKFQLKDSQFMDITQRAVWNFTDSKL